MIRLLAIRQAVVDRLKSAMIPRVLDRVYEDRGTKLWPDELPAICVYTRRTQIDGEDRQPRWYQAQTEMVIETIVRGPYDPGGGEPVQSISEQLDRITEEIVRAMIYPWDSEIRPWDEPPVGPLGGLADDIILQSITSDRAQDAEMEVGAQAVTFSVRWQTLQPDQEPPDELVRLGLAIVTPPDAHAEDLDFNDVVTTE